MVTTEKKALLLNKFFKLIFWSIETKLLTIPHFIEKKSMTARNMSSLLLSELKGYLNIFKSTQGSVFSVREKFVQQNMLIFKELKGSLLTYTNTTTLYRTV